MGSAPQWPHSPRFAPLPARVEQPAFPSELPSHHLFQLRPLWGQLPALGGAVQGCSHFQVPAFASLMLSSQPRLPVPIPAAWPDPVPYSAVPCCTVPTSHTGGQGPRLCLQKRHQGLGPAGVAAVPHCPGPGATLSWPRCSRH